MATKQLYRVRPSPGFSVEGELIFRILERLKSDKVLSVIEAVSRVGADYSSPMGPFDDYSITAGRMTTGTNPASARSAAERAVKVFDGIENT
jgi:putative intracellular protease/amidase